jgi:hypothetical protein
MGNDFIPMYIALTHPPKYKVDTPLSTLHTYVHAQYKSKYLRTSEDNRGRGRQPHDEQEDLHGIS